MNEDGQEIKILNLAIERRRWDLAAYTIVLATVSALRNGGRALADRQISCSPARTPATDSNKVIKNRGK